MAAVATLSSRRLDEVKSRKSALFDGRYEKICTLGKGNFGKVYLARDCTTGQEVAVKVVDKTSIKSGDQRQHALNEKEICEGFAQRLDHKNIVHVYEVFADHENIYVAMEYVEGGELFEKIKQRHRLEEPLAKRWFREIVEAVDYIHKNGIVHRDLKPENVLIDKYQKIRICDFGFGKFCERQQVLNTYCGSPFYAAPEMVTATPYRGPPVDMWSCGVILFAMLAGTLPFQGDDMPQLFRRINTGAYTMPQHISQEAADLISRLLCKSAKGRISAEECLKHPWLNHKNRTVYGLEPSSSTSTTTKHRPTTTTASSHPSLSRLPSSTAAATAAVDAAHHSTAQRQKQSANASTPTPTVTTTTLAASTSSSLQSSRNKKSRASRLFTKMFTKKTQVAPTVRAIEKTSVTATANQLSASQTKSKKRIKGVENKVVHRFKGLLKTAFQRRLTDKD
ncbi:kinase-like domain-containing protein [Zychaea mexicana]|uniref:kinase-like domain-containing protein n=1 Tax=Zychaea mexicana TaxID=64656 RepID=UPI0022FED739|nr:kinase-like domain-containing protein [Zychaea mexicana]KAI9490966.1 kinase-like domain-containing protein [Zychaea mexicana]